MAKLTPKQEAFVKWYVSKECHGNGTESARRAGYKGTDYTLGAVAYENLNKPYIRAEVDRRMAEATKAADVTVESVLRSITKIRDAAMKDDDYSSALRANELHGKFLAMWTEKHVVDLKTYDASDDQLDDLLLEFAQDESINLGRILEAVTTKTGIDLSVTGEETAH